MTAVLDEDTLIARLRVRASTEPLDQRLGRPGVDTDGGGAFQQLGGQLCRIYWKHTAAYERARAGGWLISASPAPPPASESALRSAEASLGLALPPLLARIYREVASGGLGPAYGLLALGNDDRAAFDRTIWRWRADGREPTTLLAILHWGCGIYSLVDAASPDARMWAYDPNPSDEPDVAIFRQELTLARWLELWLDGGLYQPCVVQDEDGTWRGATNDEVAAQTAATNDEVAARTAADDDA